MRKRRAVGLPQVLAAALLAAACSDSISPGRTDPERNGPGAPLMSFSTSGITLDQTIGTLNEGGTLLIKGFNNGNPHHGDAIVATFFWLGSTNVIDSVGDVLTTGGAYTPVGNKYALVEYVTAGGISMATYLATNVQNYPDPFTNSSQVLAVAAYLSTSVPDGGVLLSAWSGVEDVSAQALGAHSSASGSGTSSTVADAGAIPVNAGALAYGVTMSDGLSPRDPPGPPFSNVAALSDASIVGEADYAVPASAGTLDPHWTWAFNSPGSPKTWLASVLTLNAAGSGPVPGNLTATTSTSGANLDPDGYTVTVDGDGTSSQPVTINGSVTFTSLVAGSHSVALSGVAANCTVSGGNSQNATVPSGGTVTTAFSVSCSATTGNLTVSTSTTGSNLDPDGYTVTVDGGSPQAIAINASVTYPSLTAGNHTVAISGVAANCTVSGGASRTISVPSGGTATTTFSVSCNSPPTVNAGPDQTAVTGLLYSLSATFSDPDNNGPWSYTIDWGDGSRTTGTRTSQGSFTAGHTYIIILPRSFTVRVTVTDNKGASSSDTKVVSVLLL